MSRFIQVGEDILLRILLESDIHTTICVSQVNRFLHDITSAKQLWISHVKNLIQTSLIELPPALTLDELSAVRLIDLVKRLVTGPTTWSQGSPTVSSEVVIQRLANHILPFHGYCSAKLVSGGRHIIMIHEPTLEIWDVAAQRLIWTRQTYRPIFTVEPGPVNIIFVGIKRDLGNGTCLEIHEIEPKTGKSTEKFRFTFRGHTVFCNPTIRDNLVMLPLRANGTEPVLLVDWRARTYVLLADAGTSVVMPSFGLLPGHIIAMMMMSESRAQVLVYDLSVLESLWRPLPRNGLMTRVNLLAVPHLTVPLLPTDEVPGLQTIRMCIHQSPLRSGTFKISIYLSSVGLTSNERSLGLENMGPRGVLLTSSCTIRALNGNGPLFHLDPFAAHPAVPGMRFRDSTYAGYVVDERMLRVRRILSDPSDVVLPTDPSDIVLQAAAGCLSTSLSTHSGIFIQVMPSDVVLSYYR
ncbi:hypothetical protein C8R44DRAFT_846281 [Mycena epipterygia]|nr:hypothetical protein C8R44DRAFT_846281 [Mycena epipterygia]